jgi:predicted MPP superfamily phosphohydrolase
MAGALFFSIISPKEKLSAAFTIKNKNMKNFQMVIFITIVLAIYSSANAYIYLKGYNSIPVFRSSRLLYFLAFLLLASTFIAGKFLEAARSSVISDILNIIGGFWLAFMLYGFLFLLVSDIISLPLRITGVLNVNNLPVYRKWAFILTAALSFMLISGGFVNALIPRVKRYDITINKFAGNVKELKIAAVSDIHLGSIIRKRSMKKLSATLDGLKPDMVLLLGDIVDGEIGPVLRDDLLSYFKCPKCRDGLLAITGNHEFIGGAQKTIPYIESKGIRLLKDEIVVIEGGIQFIGRLDRDSQRFFGKRRMSLEELMQKADTLKPVILLDHQPFDLNESARLGVDLQLSGHTHNGQMWPLNYVTGMIYELSYGYSRINNTQFIVSSGFGLWGPRVRSGSHSEIILLDIRFEGKSQD